jgi:dipeptidyl aminopeptidase/acylaminoacyl peptidase
MRWKTCAILAAAAMLAGCPIPLTPPTIEKPEYKVDPVTKQGYYLFVPNSYRHTQPSPVIVTCHGTPPYDIAEHHIREWQWYAEQNNCIVVAPVLVGTDGIFGAGPVPEMLECERRILGILSSLAREKNLDKANIMITGFSGGGFPAYWVGLRNPDVFSVVSARNCNFNQGNLDGWWPPEAKDVRVQIYYGERDPGAIIAQSQAAIDYLRNQGFRLSTAIIPGEGHVRHPEVAMKFFRENMRPPRGSLGNGRP